MSLILYVIRHGQPLELEENRPIPNSPLGSIGSIQAKLAAEQIEKFGGVDYIYSSTYRRALDTAVPIHARLSKPWYAWPALCETNRRKWPEVRKLSDEKTSLATQLANNKYKLECIPENYYLTSQINKYYSSVELNQPIDWPDAWWLPLEGESRDVCYERASVVLDLLKQRHNGKNERIAIVCHGAFGSVLLTVLTESPPSDHNRFSFTHAGISCVKISGDGYASILFSNYFSHLYPDYKTIG